MLKRSWNFSHPLPHWAMAVLTAAALTPVTPLWAAGPALATQVAQAAGPGRSLSVDGVIQAQRQTVLAAQVAGAVVQLDVKVGDRVQAGQLLLRLDASAAQQLASAGAEQAQAVRAAMNLAAKDFERQQQLFRQHYISQAALERAEAEYKASQAQLKAQLAQAAAAQTQTGLHNVRAPYAGVVAELPVTLGDMALPGRPLLTLYDPSALRVSALVAQSVAQDLTPQATARLELPGLPERSEHKQLRLQVLPTADAATHTVELRADLPKGIATAADNAQASAQVLTPGMFVRLWLPSTGTSTSATGLASLTVPQSAVVRRAEMTGLYVLDAQQRPLLRQVRLGAVLNGRVEVLSGLRAGEAVVTDGAAAAAQSR